MHCCYGKLISSISSHDRFSVGKPQTDDTVLFVDCDNTWTVVTREWVRGRQLTDLMTVLSLGSGLMVFSVSVSRGRHRPEDGLMSPASNHSWTNINHIVTSLTLDMRFHENIPLLKIQHFEDIFITLYISSHSWTFVSSGTPCCRQFTKSAAKWRTSDGWGHETYTWYDEAKFSF